MRVTILTMMILVGADSDVAPLLWFVALLPLFLALAALALYLAGRPSARPRVWQEGERHLSPETVPWRPAHRRTSRRPEPGKHAPARGTRLEGLSRQAQLEERTESVTAVMILGAVGRAGVTDPLKETTEAWQASSAHEHKPYRDGLRIRCETCHMDIDQPDGMPEVGRGGFSSWA